MLFFDREPKALEGIKGKEKRIIGNNVDSYIQAIGGPLHSGFVESSTFIDPKLWPQYPGATKDEILEIMGSTPKGLALLPKYDEEKEKFLKNIRDTRAEYAQDDKLHNALYNANVVEKLSRTVDPNNTKKYRSEVASAAGSILGEMSANITSQKDKQIVEEILSRINSGIRERAVSEREGRDYLKRLDIPGLLSILISDSLSPRPEGPTDFTNIAA